MVHRQRPSCCLWWRPTSAGYPDLRGPEKVAPSDARNEAGSTSSRLPPPLDGI